MHRKRHPIPLHLQTVVFVTGLFVAVAGPAISATAETYSRADAPGPTSRPTDSLRADPLAQNDDAAPDLGVPPDQVEKYIAVYKDMQRNHSLTVDMAAAAEGLTIAEFRELERKVGRDEAAREHVRIELQAGAASTP
ncbi:MAG TPA: hypothetical protein VHS07_00690 [Candidatus Binataceae bacterium]|nr:hypothetical protein [Candidatus Binataceae bacterium]